MGNKNITHYLLRHNFNVNLMPYSIKYNNKRSLIKRLKKRLYFQFLKLFSNEIYEFLFKLIYIFIFILFYSVSKNNEFK